MGGVTRTLTCVGLVTTAALLLTNLTPDGTPTSLLGPAQVFFTSSSATHADRAALLSAADAALSPGPASHDRTCRPAADTATTDPIALVKSSSRTGHVTHAGLTRSAGPLTSACIGARSARWRQPGTAEYASLRLWHHLHPRTTLERL
ncbi:hypothetical protein [Nonomuraea maritima]|uniref:hypothetical protein n=1 Tax=Nonomuraea maritima TaxID=683260 RepID=UPI00371B69D5